MSKLGQIATEMGFPISRTLSPQPDPAKDLLAGENARLDA